MEKSKVPTSQYKVFCDTFDMELTAKIHQVDKKDGYGGMIREDKLLIEMQKESSEEKLSLSLYREDVQMMIGFLEAVKKHIDYRDELAIDKILKGL